MNPASVQAGTGPEVPVALPRPTAQPPTAAQAPARPPAPAQPATAAPPAPPRVAFDPVKMAQDLREAIDQLNRQMTDSGRTLGFTMDSALSVPIIKVRDTKTGEVIRQIPSEVVVQLAHSLESLKGLLHDQAT